MLAVMIGVLLSVCASAWATTSYGITMTAAAYRKKCNIDTDSGTPITIPIQALVAVSGQDLSSQGYTTAATKVVFSYSDPDGVLTSPSITDAEQDVSSTPETYIKNAKLKGTAQKSGTVTITATLYNGTSPSTRTNTSSLNYLVGPAEIIFTTESGSDVVNTDFITQGPSDEVVVYDENPNPIDATGANFDDKELWNGIDPVFTNAISSYDKKLKPKIATSKPSFTKAGASAKALKAGVSDDFKVEIKGPVTEVNVYVAAKDAKKLWGYTGSTNITLNSKDIESYKIPFRVTAVDLKSKDLTKDTVNSVTIAYNGAHLSYKGFPITVSAKNANTTKDVTKTYKINIDSGRAVPQWVTPTNVVGDNLPKKNTEEIAVAVATNSTVGSLIYTASADAPYTITVKGDKNGLKAAAVQPVLNKYGEVKTAGYAVISGDITEAEKETKTAFTLTAAGLKKTAFKATVIGKIAPIIQKTVSKDGYPYIETKRSQAGKVPSISFSAKGSKTITWDIDPESQAALEEHNLSFDKSKGKIIAKDSSKKELITPTIDDGELASIDIHVYAINDVGQDDAYAEVAITVRAVKLTTKTLTVSKDALLALDDYDTYEDASLSADVSKAKDGEYTDVTFSVADEASETALSDLGLGLDEDGYLYIVSSKDIKATKGAKINVNVDHYGAVTKGKFTLIIKDPMPEIEGDNAASLTGSDTAAVTEDLALALTSATKPTDGAKISWKVKDNSEKKSVSAKIKADKSDSSKATLTVGIKKKFTDTKTATITIIATNGNSKLASKPYTVTVNTNPASTTPTASASIAAVAKGTVTVNANAGAGAEAEAQAKDEADDDDDEVKVVFGAPRTAANLTAGQAAFIQGKGYTVIAVLPEVTADEDGQVEIPVELDEDAPEGAKMVYLPFAKDGGAEDDEIVDFYDEAGAPIEEVPAGKNITAAPWLRAGVTYQPVIAVESK